MNPATLIEAFSEQSFLIGLVLGVVAALGALVHRRGSLWILSVGIAGILGLLIAEELEELPTPSVEFVAIGSVAVIVGSIGVWLLSRDVGHGTVSIALAVTALGVWGTVPDTELALVLLGAVFGGTIGVLRLEGRPIGPVWPVALLGVAAFVAFVDGRGRAAAPVGAIAAFGILLLFPLIFGLLDRAPAWLVVAAHVVLVIVCGRIAGTASSVASALLIAVAAHVAVGVGLVVVSRRLAS